MSNFKKITTLGLIFTSTLSLAACGHEEDVIDISNMEEIYESLYVGSTDDWEYAGNIMGAEAWIVDETATFNILSEGMKGHSEDEYLEATLYHLEQGFGLDSDEIDVDETSFNGYDATVISYTTDSFGVDQALQQYIIYGEDTAYVLSISDTTGELSEDSIDKVEDVLDSLVIQEESKLLKEEE